MQKASAGRVKAPACQCMLPGSSHYTTRCFLFLAVAADCCLLPVDLGTLPVDLALAAAGFELELEPFLVPVDLELAPGPLPVARLGLLDTGFRFRSLGLHD